MLTQERVKELLEYRDGDLLWKETLNHRFLKGEIAGARMDGYLSTTIDDKIYFNHRIIWLMHHGYTPENILDHIDRDRANNKIENLREVSYMCNSRNSKLNRNNKTGVKGVCLNQFGIYIATITILGKTIFCGSSSCLIEASAKRLAYEQCVKWENCESNSTAFRCVQKYLSDLSPMPKILA